MPVPRSDEVVMVEAPITNNSEKPVLNGTWDSAASTKKKLITCLERLFGPFFYNTCERITN